MKLLEREEEKRYPTAFWGAALILAAQKFEAPQASSDIGPPPTALKVNFGARIIGALTTQSKV